MLCLLGFSLKNKHIFELYTKIKLLLKSGTYGKYYFGSNKIGIVTYSQWN